MSTEEVEVLGCQQQEHAEGSKPPWMKLQRPPPAPCSTVVQIIGLKEVTGRVIAYVCVHVPINLLVSILVSPKFGPRMGLDRLNLELNLRFRFG